MLFTPAQQTWGSLPSSLLFLQMIKVMGVTLALECSAAGPSSLPRALLLCIKLFAEKTGSLGYWLGGRPLGMEKMPCLRDWASGCHTCVT